ncbi:hypothetical protein BRARA_G01540 [Brassica rapa]|uniref:Uncharacterized protein n=1 Tax=Brassica campestris TaxID=3711 RepID=A0A397YT19_BRACM|nr:hypothetical protein BRARA_G01540 [Brassica rapa]
MGEVDDGPGHARGAVEDGENEEPREEEDYSSSQSQKQTKKKERWWMMINSMEEVDRIKETKKRSGKMGIIPFAARLRFRSRFRSSIDSYCFAHEAFSDRSRFACFFL